MTERAAEQYADNRTAVVDPEWRMRRDLAALYRLIDHHGWIDLIYNHVSARIPGSPDHYLVNPYGMLFEEITAASLVKVEIGTGDVVSSNSQTQTNIAAHDLHAPVLASRPDLCCVAHVHTPAIMAVSAMADGLLPLTQTAMSFYNRIGFHDYGFGPDAKERMIRDFHGNDTVILRNHGVMIGGRTIAETYVQLHNFQMACEAQVRIMATGNKISMPPQAIIDSYADNIDFWFNRPGGPRDPDNCLEWQAALRMLERRGFSGTAVSRA